MFYWPYFLEMIPFSRHKNTKNFLETKHYKHDSLIISHKQDSEIAGSLFTRHPVFAFLTLKIMFVINVRCVGKYLPLSLKYFKWLAMACSLDSSGHILTPVGKKIDLFLRNKRLLNVSDSLKSRRCLESRNWGGLVNRQSSDGRSGVASLTSMSSAGKYISSVKLHHKQISLGSYPILYCYSRIDIKIKFNWLSLNNINIFIYSFT